MKAIATLILFLSSIGLFSQCMSGDCVNGFGTYYYGDGKMVYTGNFKGGRKNGQGELIFKGEYKYVGEWKDGRRSGKGVAYYDNGWIYDGFWLNDTYSGQGKLVTGGSANGIREGEFKDGYLISGKDISWGETKEGNFVDTYLNGKGTIYYSNGDRYVGFFKKGSKTGKGTIYYKNGDKYEGAFDKYDKFTGEGKFTYANGATKEGEWLNGQLIKEYKLNYANIIIDKSLLNAISIGSITNGFKSSYSSSSASNKFIFYENPISLGKNREYENYKPKLNFSELEVQHNNILAGIDSLKKLEESIKNEINFYIPSYRKKTNYNEKNEKSLEKEWESLYKKAMDAKNLYLVFAEKSSKEYLHYNTKIKKWIDKTVNSSGLKTRSKFEIIKFDWGFIFIDNLGDPNFDKKMKSLMKKGDVERVSLENRDKFLLDNIGVDGNFFKQKSEQVKITELIAEIQTHFDKIKLSGSPQQFDYVGQIENGQPEGYGYLIINQDSIVLKGYWHNGNPLLLYEGNIYRSYFGKRFDYRYENANGELFCIDAKPIENKESKYNSFNLYIGEYQSNNSGVYSGFGICFYGNSKNEELTYYQGLWKENKMHGNGKYYKNSGSAIYTGKFSNDEMTTGTCSLSNGEIQSGDFEHWKLQGKGELSTSNGIKKNGYFDKGVFVKSTEQFQKEIDEENRKVEEQRLANEKAEQEKRKRELVCSLNLAPPRPPYKYVDNRVMCAYCNDKYARYKLGGVEKEIEAKTNFAINQLVFHVLDNNWSEEHLNNDVTKLSDLAKDWIAECGDLGLDGVLLASTIVVGLPVSVAQALEFAKMGLLKRQKTFTVDKYENTSRFCSEKCYREGSTGEFDW
jgi:hypothetical protein